MSYSAVYLGLCFCNCFCLVGLFLSYAEQALIGPQQPVWSLVGDDVTLPCRLLSPAGDAVDLTVEWSRLDLSPRYVHVRQDGRDLQELQNLIFSSRTSLFLQELQYGNVSLKLSRVELSDRGNYSCFIPSLKEISVVGLFVMAGRVSSPLIKLGGIKDGGVDLQCESGGWYPEPEVDWLDSEEHVLSAGPTETVKDSDGTFTVTRNVTVEKNSTNRFTCRVQQQHINQTRAVHISILEDVFSPCSCGSLWVLFFVSGVAVGAATFCCWLCIKYYKNKSTSY